MPAFSADTAFWALDLALRATLILALASLTVALLARASAALRHVVWTSAVAALLALPVLVLALPAWRALPRWEKPRPAPLAAPALPPTPATVVPAVPEALAIPAAEPAPAIAPVPDGSALARHIGATIPVTTAPAWPAWLLATWLAGAAALLVPLVVAAIALRRLRRSAAPCTLPLAQELLAECRREFTIRRRVCLLVAPGATPMTFGILHPHVLLPTDSAAWSPDRWRLVLRHELAHIQRHDLLSQLLAQLMRALYWFHPLAWLACARMAAERERACDDLTLAGTEPAAYAAELFAVARAARPATRAQRLATAAAVPMARFSSLESRVRAILDVHRNRRRLSAAALLATFFASLAILLPLAALRAADGPATTPATTTANGNLRRIGQAMAAYSSSQPGALPATAPSPALLAFLQAEVDRAKHAFDDTAELDAAKAQLAQDQAALEDLQRSPVPQAMAVENLTLKIALGQARVESALNRHALDQLAYNQALKRLQDLHNAVAPAAASISNPLNTIAAAPATVATPAGDPALIAIQEAEVEIARHRAQNTAQIDGEKAVVESKQKDLARLQALPVPAAELEQARLDLAIALARLRIAESQREENLLRFKQAEARLQAVKRGISPAVINATIAEPVYTPAHSAAEDEAALALARHRADDTVDIDGCKAIVEHAQINLDRVKTLHDQGLIAQGELDQATAEMAQNRAQLARAVSQHEEEVLKYKLLQQQIQSHKPIPSAGPASGTPIIPADADLPPDQPGEFYVLGAVPRPGVYSLTGRKITVKQALAATGIDPVQFPELVVTLTRRSDNNTETIIHNIHPAAQFAGTEPDRFLQPNDILKVESTAATQPATATRPVMSVQDLTEPGHM